MQNNPGITTVKNCVRYTQNICKCEKLFLNLRKTHSDIIRNYEAHYYNAVSHRADLFRRLGQSRESKARHMFQNG